MASPLRVLLVDDNPDDRALVARELRAEYGAVEIEEVIDAAGLELALERTYDLAITDYHLNWSDGLAVLRRIKERDPGWPIVMFTGTGTEEVAVEAMREGLDDYVIKSPQHFKRLVSATHRAIERATRQRDHRRLLAIMEATPDFVGTSGADGRILYLNASGREMLGIPADEDLTRIPIADCHPDWAAELIATEALPQALAEGTWRGESALRTRDGRDIPVSQVVIAHATHAGSVDYFSTVARDMSSERSLQEQLQRAQKMEAVGRLAGGIAHDFNNLLTVILGEAEHARERASDPEVRQSLQEIRRAAARATKVTGQLLQFSSGRPSESTVFDLDELVRSMQSMIRRMIREDIRLVVRTTEGPGKVRADRGQVEQVLLNLVANARDAMPAGGLLALETANVSLSDDAQVRGPVEPGRYAMLAVSDSGTGMGPEVKERLFEPFFSTKEAGKGSGIGLATSYGIVRRHGGYIGVYSEVEQGTIMRVYLPQVDAPADAPSFPEIDPWEEFAGTGSILVVEDDDALRGVTARMLETLGYRTEVAADSEEALRLLSGPERDVDLLLTDVVLRETDGPRLARAAREIRPDLRVLFMSGYTEEVLAHRSGGEMPLLLRKPFAVADLGAKVRAALEAETA